MADVTIKIIEPATNFDLMTVEELKISLGVSDASQDAQLEDYIDRYSDVISVMCNRVFARETVRETWRCVGSECPGTRIFLSHWPIKEEDVVAVETPIGNFLDPLAFEVEERSGKVELVGSAVTEMRVTYIGGFNLPEEAPEALKQACVLMIQHAKQVAQMAATSGIRSLSHKDARVQFYDPNAALRAQQRAPTSGIDPAINSLLMHYVRLQV